MMPYVHVETNQVVKEDSVLSQISSFMTTLLDKPENWMMISIDDQKKMIFAGQTEPCAIIQIKSIGLSVTQCKEIAPKICSFFESLLLIPGERIYIDMIDIDRRMFAWNGNIFG
jgi:phenylpyruvate tautomerase PptA (4-oxalocrotonate tautomerase family)